MAAAALAGKAEKGSAAELESALEKISQTAKVIADLEKSQAEIRKLTAEEQKARYDLEHASRTEWRRTLTVVAPFAATLLVAVTLAVQTFQFFRSEKDKREASEDTQWSEAVKTLSQSAKLSPAVIVLNPFLKSKRYAEVARQTAVQLL